MKYTHDTRANKMEEYRITIQVKKRAIHDDTRYWGKTDPILGGNRAPIPGRLLPAKSCSGVLLLPALTLADWRLALSCYMLALCPLLLAWSLLGVLRLALVQLCGFCCSCLVSTLALVWSLACALAEVRRRPLRGCGRLLRGCGAGPLHGCGGCSAAVALGRSALRGCGGPLRG